MAEQLDGRSADSRAGRRGHWYVARTKVGGELLAGQSLAANGFTTFTPQLQRMSRSVRAARPPQVRLVPMFPGYVFLSLDLRHDAWRLAAASPGVVDLLGARGGRPDAVPADVMDAIVARHADARPLPAYPDLVPGRRARVLDGPFADLMGEIASFDGNGRVAVLLEVLGRSTRVSLHPSRIAAQ